MNPNQAPSPEEEGTESKAEKMEIKNTDGFHVAIEKGGLEAAENFLAGVKSGRERWKQYDDRWVDHRERELFQAYYTKQDWTGAKRIVESSLKEMSKEGRKKRLVELSGMKYEEI